MPSTLAVLLHRSLDFAGLFPPASLPVPDALQLFRGEQSANTAEMLARFVCPVLRLEELTTAAAGLEQPLAVSVLPRGGKNAGEFLANLEVDLASIRRIAQMHAGLVSIDALEVRPPADALAQPALRKLLAAVDALLSRHAGLVGQLFVELAPGPALASQLELLAERAARPEAGTLPIGGYKLRTGGSDAAATPPAAHVAVALATVAALGLPMKCTGGLHRPLRTAGEATPLHGFVNLLVAAAFAATDRDNPATLETLLEETDPAVFSFDAKGLTWRERALTTAAVAKSRKQLLLSFGSCYVEQPRLELQKLGWWPRPARATARTLA